MNNKDNFQILRDERTKLVNEIADLQTENAELREAMNAMLVVIQELESTLLIKIENQYLRARLEIVKGWFHFHLKKTV